MPLFTSSIGLLIILLYIPGGFIQIGYWFRGSILNWLEQRLPRSADEDAAPRRRRRSRARRPAAPLRDRTRTAACSRRTDLTVRFGGIVAVDDVDFRADAGEVIGLIGTNGAGKSTLLNAIGGYVPSAGHGRAARDATSRSSRRTGARTLGLGPHVPGRDAVPGADRARDGAARARGPAAPPRSGDRCSGCPARPAPSGRSGPRRPSSSTSSGSAGTPTGSSPSSRPAPAASSSWPRCSRSRRGCSASTSRPPGSPSARPRRSAR